MLFKRIIAALVIVPLMVNPALAQQPLPELIKQQELRSKFSASEKLAGAAAPDIAAVSQAVQVDLAAEQARQAGIKQASNGTTVIDITAPSAAGVSHNQFTEFNVNKNGLILNNSLAPVLTQLGGWSDGNRRLAGGEAKIILNEVTGMSRSDLLGYIEIAGQSAEFVLANANGISCDGCGFINTPRVTLVTGQPDIVNGSLQGFRVNSGEFNLGSNGLNAANIDRFDILTRAAKINGELYARQLNVYTGENYIDYNNGNLTVTNSNTAPAFQFALDASAVGAMYANSIRLIGTEQGMGVNFQGLIQSVNDLELSADGNVVIKNAQANNTIALTSHSGSITTTGTLYAARLNLAAGENIENKNLLAAGEEITLAGENFLQGGNLYVGLDVTGNLSGSGKLTATLNESINNKGTLYIGGDFALETDTIVNDQGNIILQTADSLTAAGDLVNSGLIQFNSTNANIGAINFDNSAGTIQLTQGGSINLDIDQRFDNRQGKISVTEQITLAAETLDNTEGLLAADKISLTAATADNNQGYIQADNISLAAGELYNREGVINAAGTDADSLAVTVADTLDNTSGLIYTRADTQLVAGNIHNTGGEIIAADRAQMIIKSTDSINNTQGIINADRLNLDAQNLTNDGGVIDAQWLNLDIQQLLSNNGHLQADTIIATAEQYRSQGGVLLALGTSGQALSLDIKDSIHNRGGAVIESHSGNLVIKSRYLENNNSQINLLGNGQLAVNADTISNNHGQLAALTEIKLDAAQVDNLDGNIQAQQIIANAQQINNRDGSLVADSVQLTAQALDNTAGLVNAQQGLGVNLNSINNSGGRIHTGARNANLQLTSIDNTNGRITHSGTGIFSLNLEQLLNSSGTVATNGSLNIQARELNNSAGGITAAQQIQINSNQLNNNSGTLAAGGSLGINTNDLNNGSGRIQGGNLQINSGTLNNAGGVINAQGNLILNAASLNNNSGIVNAGNLALSLNQLTNIRGLLQGSQISLSVPELDNTDGTIRAHAASGAGLQLQVSGLLNNTRGNLSANGAGLTLDAARLNNTGGYIEYRGNGKAAITTAQLDNNNGQIFSDADLQLNSESLINGKGSITAVQDAEVNVSNTLDNTDGSLMAGNNQQVSAGHLVNNNGVLSAKNLALDSDQVDNLGQGIIEADELALAVDNLNNEGNVIATGTGQEALVFNVNKFNNAGRLEVHSENLLLSNLDLTSTGGEIVHLGTGMLHIQGNNTFDNRDGIIASQGSIKLETDAVDNRAGQLIANKDLLVTLGELNNEAGIIQSGNGLSLTLDNFNNSNGGQLIMSGTAPSDLTIAGELNNRNGTIAYWGESLLSITADILDNSQGGTLGGSGAIDLDANQFNNNGGNILGGSHINLRAVLLDNDQGTIESGSLALDAGTINNKGVIFTTGNTHDSLSINADQLNNNGVIETYGVNLTLANTNLDNSGGVIVHRGSGVLAITQQQLNNQGGSIVGLHDVQLTLTALDNIDDGEIVAANNLQLDINRILNHQSLLQAGQALAINADQLENLSDAKIINLGNSLAGIHSDSINNESVIAANGNLQLQGTTIDNSGRLQSQTQLDIAGVSLVNTGFIDAADVVVDVQTLTNQAAGQIQAGAVQLNADTWNHAGSLLVHDENKTSAITLNEFHNTGLLESHNSNVSFSAQLLNNSGGEIVHQGSGDLLLQADALENTDGLIAANKLAINTVNLNNSAGEIVADDLVAQTATLNNQSGLLQTNNSLQLTATQLDNRAGGLLLATGTANTTLNIDQLDNRQGTLAVNNLILTSDSIDNRDGEVIADNLQITSHSIDNSNGVIAATDQGNADNMQLSVSGILDNQQGLIQGGGQNSAITAGTLDNTAGEIIHAGAGVLAITADQINNRQGGSIVANKDLALTVSGLLENDASLISAMARANLQAATITNSGGKLIAGERLEIQATNLVNGSAANLVSLISSDWLQLTVDTITNQASGRIDAGHMQIDGNQLNNQGLLLAAESQGESLIVNLQELHNTGRIEAAGEDLSLNNININNAGDIIHRGAGVLRINQGQLVNNQGLLDSAGAIAITVNSVENRAGVIVARADAGIGLTAQQLDNSEGLLTAKNIQLNSQLIDNTLGEISGETLAIDAHDFTNAGGIVSATDLAINAETFTNAYSNNLAGILDAKTLALTAAQLNNQAFIQAEQLQLQGNQFNNNQGVLLATATQGNALQMNFSQGISNYRGSIESHSDNLAIGNELDNREGQVLLTGNGELTLAKVNNNNGKLLSNGNLAVVDSGLDAELSNEQGLIQALNNINVQIDTINNRTGTIAAGNGLTLVSHQLTNQSGLLVADGSGDNSLQLQVTNPIDNTQGVIETRADNFSLDNLAIINTQGQIRHLGAGTFAVNSTGDFTNGEGLLYSTGTLAVNVAGEFINQGNLVAVNQLDINAAQVTNEQQALMDAAITQVTGEQIRNRGRIQGDAVQLTGNRLDNQSGELLALGTADNSLQLALNAVDNTDNGLIESHSNNLILAAAINNQGGNLLHLGAGTFTLTDLFNQNGQVYSAGNLAITQSALNNQGGILEAAGDTRFQLTSMDNRNGYVRAGKQLQLNATQLDNSTGGVLQSVEGFSLDVTGVLNNEQGQLASLAQQMQINTAELKNALGQVAHYGTGRLDLVSGALLDNSGGQIITNGEMDLQATRLLNNARANQAALIKANDLAITADELQNQGGHIQADQHLLLDLLQLNNQGGSILSLGTSANAFELLTTGVDNRSGILEVHSNTLDLSGFTLDNRGGVINHQGSGELRIVNSNTLQNAGGALQSLGNIHLDVAALDNKAGLIKANQLTLAAVGDIDNSQAGTMAAEQLVLTADTIKNNGGLIAATGNTADALTFNTQNMIDNSAGVIRNSATDWSLQLEQINNTGGSIVHQGSGTFTLTNSGTLTNTGTIASIANLHINAGAIANQGNLVADNNLVLNANGQITNATGAVIKGTSALNVAATQLTNQGEIVSGTALAIDVDGQVDNRGVLVTNAANASITAGTISNDGTLAHNGNGNLSLTAATITNTSGVLKSVTGLTLNAASISNGNVISAANLNAAGFNSFNNNGHLETVSTSLSGNTLNNYGTFNASGGSVSLLVNNLLNAGNFYSGSYNQSFSGSFTNSGQFVHTGTGTLSLGNAGAVTLSGGSVSTAGAASLTNGISGNGSLFAKSGISIGGGGTFNNNGSSLYTQGNLTINAAVNNVSGSMIADGQLNVSTSGTINNNSGWLQGAQVNLTAGTLANINGTIISSGAGSGSIQASTIDNSGGGKIASGNNSFSVTATGGDINNQGGSIIQQNTGSLLLSAAGQLNNRAGKVNTQGQLTANANGIINTNAGEIVANTFALNAGNSASGFDNSGGTLIATGSGDSRIEAIQVIKNAAGIIGVNSNNLTLTTSGEINNNAGKIDHFGTGLLRGNYNSFANAGGAVRSNGNIDWSTAGNFFNNGEISALATLKITAGSVTNSGVLGSRAGIVDIDVNNSSVINMAGASIGGAEKVEINAQSLTNNGTLESDNIVALTLKSLGAIGSITARNLLDLDITDSINVAAGETIKSSGSLRINTQGDLTNKGMISTEKTLTLSGNYLSNEGTIAGGSEGNSSLDFDAGIQNQGRISSKKDLTITSQYLNNYNTVAAGENLVINSGAVANLGNSVMFSGKDMTLSVASLRNEGSTLFANKNMSVNAQGYISNTAGRIESIGTMSLSAGSILNSAAKPTVVAGTKTTASEQLSSEVIRTPNDSFGQGNSSSNPYYNDPEMILEKTKTITTESTPYTVVPVGANAVIASGGNMSLNGGNITNTYGTISTGGNLSISGSNFILLSVVDYSDNKITTAEKTRLVNCHFSGGCENTVLLGTEEERVYGTNAIGVVRVAGNITGNLAGSIEQVLKDHSSGNQSADTSTAGGNNGAGNRGNQANAASGNGASVGGHSGSAANTNSRNLNYNNQVSGNNINAGGQGNGGVGSVDNLDATDINGNIAAGNQYSASTEQQVGAGASGIAIGTQAGNGANQVGQSSVNQAGANGRDGAVSGSLPDDIQALKDQAFAALLGEPATNNATAAGAPQDAAKNLEGQDSNLANLDDLQPGTEVFDETNARQDLKQPQQNNTGAASGGGSVAVSGVNGSNAAGPISSGAGKADANIRAPETTVIEVLPGNFNPANVGGLYVENKNPASNVLIETRPEFTDYTNFLGSDYLLKAIGYNPDKTIKRLGDAFFENQLIRDAMVNQASTRFVGSATNDYDQMQMLMDNAVAANQSLQLSVGVALTKEQAAALTSDIIWLVEKTVNGEKVLVPELYLASVDKASLLPSGAVMSAGGKMDLWSGNGISTQGTIASRDLLSLGTLGNFDQGGTIASNTGVMLSAGQDFTNRGQVTGPLVSVYAGGDITNLNTISATNFLGLTGDSITNTAGSTLQSGGWLNLTAQNDIRNQQGLIEGMDVSLVSREGSIINRTEFSTVTSPNGRIINTQVGDASTILSHNSLTLDAGKDLDLQGSQFKAAQDITFKAGNDILLGAIELVSSRDNSTRKVINNSSETSHQVVSIEAGHKLTLDAGRDLNAEGTQFKAGGDASLSAGRDLNLTALANTSHSESIAGRKKVIDTETTHTLVTVDSGGNVSLKAGQDANLTGTTVNAAGNVSLAATRDVNLTAVVDSDYHYDYTKKKKSFGRSKTTENETLDQTVTGGVINAGGNILVNSHVDSTGKLVTDESGKVNILGGVLNAGGSVVVAADDDINISGMTYEELDFHRTKKSGLGGLSKKDKGEVETDTKLQNALITAGGDAHFLSGNNLTLAATDVMVDGNINLEAVDKLLITAGEVVSNSERWSKKSGLGSGGNLYGSKEHKSGEGVTSGQASTLDAGGKITGRVGSGEIIGSDLTAGQGVKIVSDMGDIDVSASRTTTTSYSYDKEMSVGLGDVVKSLTRPDQLIKNEDGRATIKLANAQYDEVDTKTNTTSMRGSTITSNEDITLVATAGSVNITGSTLNADADQNNSGTLGLAGATGVTVQEATDTYETSTKEVHGSAELSVVVQHQAAEVAKATIAVDEAKDKLEQAKKDYKAYERNVSQLEDQLSQLESDYANKVPGVNYDDLLELRELVSDVKGDKEWYQAGIAMAAVNLTSATTALVQQTAAAAQSAGTWGFNAGLQLDVDASKSNTTEKGTNAVASNLSGNKIVIQTGTVGEDGKLNTQGTSTTISGSHLNANDRISIQTGDLNLLASKDTYERQSEQEHGHITAQMTVYGASGGASVNGSFDRSKESERGTSYNNTTLTANNIDLTTSGDANIRGANVHANDHLEVDIQGNLNLESLQDRSNSRNTSAGISGGFSLGGQKDESTVATLNKTLNGNAFTNNLQGAGNVGGVAGVNGGISAGNGMSVTRETVLTSMTSGGTANVNVKGNTQITGALLATINEDGSDRNLLDFSTGSLNFTDLRNLSQNNQTNAGLSANFSVGEKKADTPNPREGQTTAEGANGDTLYASTSNLTYSNSQQNSASQTLATLGHGNITVGGTQLEKDGELTEAGKATNSPLIGMNRDTANTEKELWNSEQSQTVDMTLDHRLLTKDGQEEIKEDIKKAANGIAAYFSDIDSSLKEQTGEAGSRAYDAARRMGLSDSAANALLSDPETLSILTQLNKAEAMLNQPAVIATTPDGNTDTPVYESNGGALPTVIVNGTSIPYNAIETATFAMDDASRYINELRETNPKKAATLEGVISVATGGPLKAAVGKGIELGLDKSGLGEKVAEQTKKITDPVIEAGASGISGYDPTLEEFRSIMEETGADGDESKLKGGTGFFISSVLGIAGGVGGKGKDDSTIGGNRTKNEPVAEGDVGDYGDLASRSVGDGLTPDHIPSYASVRKSLDEAEIELSDEELKVLRNNTNCVVVKTCDHQDFSRTYGGRNSQEKINTDSKDLYRAAEADLDAWEPVWRKNGWSESKIQETRKQVHELNKKLFEDMGVSYGS